MIALWNSIIRPVVQAADGRNILEIGAEAGLSTRALLNYVRSVDGNLHCIDPVPGFDSSKLVDQSDGRLHFYEDLSLNVLRDVPPVDVAMVDGDHNWYTVYNELKLIEETHLKHSAALPIIFVHDMGWPYGRRDLYYAPETIPEEFVHPYARRPIGRGATQLLEAGRVGMNADLCNAIEEGGPRNGVLTGVEDFLEESAVDYCFLSVPLYFGLGILVAEDRLAGNPDLQREISRLERQLEAGELISVVEEQRLNLGTIIQRLQGELRASEAAHRRARIHPRSAAELDPGRTMNLSVIIVAYDMGRELPRSLASLSRDYQLDCEDIEYEVLVVDNGSPDPLPESAITSLGPEFTYHPLENPPPSPSYAINYGVQRAKGEIICLMVDGAHILTPGLLSKGLAMSRAFPNAVGITRYFYLGWGPQNETMLEGYDQAKEDALLDSIDWPRDGYRLFEIGTPLTQKDFPQRTWFYKSMESNCLFLRRDHFEAIGGADERMDLPGGGFMNLDLFKRACDTGNARPVVLIGEGSFHQVHGGTTTNVSPDEQQRRVDEYKDQYRELIGTDLKPIEKELYFFGHLPTVASMIHRKQPRSRPGQGGK